MPRRRTNFIDYPWSEKDWPVLLHVMISIRPVARTTGWITMSRTGPKIDMNDVYKVTYTSDSRDDSLRAMKAILDAMMRQLERQLELKKEIEK